MSCANGHSQEGKPFIRDAFVSYNHTLPGNRSGTTGKSGFGLGAYHILGEGNIAGAIFGVEFNRTRLAKDHIYQGRFASAKNALVKLNSLSVPVALRLGVGKKTRVFLDLGAYLNVLLYAGWSGTMKTSGVNNGRTSGANERTFSRKMEQVAPLDYGPLLGVGCVVPVWDRDLMIRAGYKFGFVNLYEHYGRIYNRNLRLAVGVRF